MIVSWSTHYESGTHLMGRPATGKRQRLVAAAIEQFHRQGYARTSLAAVAQAAGLSAGNIFYYFKAKDDLASAVIDEWCAVQAGYLAQLESEACGWQRIEGFLQQAQVMRDVYVTLGCPLAGLTRDLRRESDALNGEVARVYAVQFQWLATQFARCGATPARAEDYSRTLMTDYHGAILLAYTQADASLIDDAVERLRNWIEALRAASLKEH